MQGELKETSLCISPVFRYLSKMKIQGHFSVLVGLGFGVWCLVRRFGFFALLSFCSYSIKEGNYYEIYFPFDSYLNINYHFIEFANSH